MSDIRNFFGVKGGAPPKPAPKKEEQAPKTTRAKRKVVEDSDDDDVVEVKAAPKSKPAPKKKAADKEPSGTAISADDYFASNKNGNTTKPEAAAKTIPKSPAKTDVAVRSSPRAKAAPAKAKAPTKNGNRKPTTTRGAVPMRNDDDAYMEDADDDDQDIFAANAKGGVNGKHDDYEESESDEDIPQPKRAAPRGRQSAANKVKDEDEDEDEEDVKPAKKSTATRKRKSPEHDSDEEEEEEAPRKKPSARKPAAPKAKKADQQEDAEYASILNSVATVRAPTPPPADGTKKFDWRQAKGGGNAAVVPPAGAAEIPEGEDGCLTGLNFVFTGVLQTLGRDEGAELVKRYGGKVTGAPSSKTSFVVLGEDAGPSKLAKIKANNIKTIDEHGLFDLIKKLPAHGGSGVGAVKAAEKKKKDEEKVKADALAMEREEKQRKTEAEAAAKKAAAARGTAAPAKAPQPEPVKLLTSKYAPTQMSHICGNKAQVDKIQKWLREWPKNKKYDFKKRGADGMGAERAIIISGPPGIGKTTAAHLAAKLEGYDVLESNASDTRSKKLVENGVSDVMNNTSLLGYFAGDGKDVDKEKKHIVLIMDEVDGMSAGDRGGVGALAKFCKKTEVPLILICNERRLPKMKPFDHAAFDIRFNRPTVDQVRSRIMTICMREGLKLPVNVIDALIEGSNKDIRQIINMISTAKLDQNAMDFDQSKKMSKAWEKHVVLKPWDICQKMLGGGLFAPASKATLNDKIELYFNDHEFSFLMIQENYLRTKPMTLSGKGYSDREMKLKALELFDQAAESISDGDLVDRMIHGPQQHWSLMPTHAVFSTVRPASFVSGQLMGSQFTSWLGNHSKTGKLGRFTREIHSHMRLKASGDHNEIRQEYLPVLWSQLVKKLEVEGPEAVPDVIDLMDNYYLTREDFDAIQELGVGHMSEDHIKIETATKSAFTRNYNKMSHPVPFMKASNAAAAPKAAAREAPDLEEAIEEEDDGQAAEPVEVDEDEIDFKKDKYIKQPKKKPAPKKTAAKAKAADDDEDEAAPKKGRGRPKAAAKPKAKK